MAVTNIAFNNDGDTDKYLFEQNIYCVNTPFTIKFDCTYNGGVPPEDALVSIYESLFDGNSYSRGSLLAQFNAIPYDDPSSTVRTFIFITDGIFKAFMEDYGDYFTMEKAFAAIPELTKDFWLEITSQGKYFDPFVMMFLQRAHQFGQRGYVKIPEAINTDNPAFASEQVYYGAENKPLYLYTITQDPEGLFIVDDSYGRYYAFDFNDIIFKAPDDYMYKI